jgi:hypothetical protein|tara:strand:- start:87 stop:380 length:294 start_codon:yes stop_codon:yes gene_type:complete
LFHQFKVSPSSIKKCRFPFRDEKKQVLYEKRDDEEREIGLEVKGEKGEHRKSVQFFPLRLLLRYERLRRRHFSIKLGSVILMWSLKFAQHAFGWSFF